MTPVLEFLVLLMGLVGSVASLAVTIGYMLSHPAKGDKKDDDEDAIFRLRKDMGKWR